MREQSSAPPGGGGVPDSNYLAPDGDRVPPMPGGFRPGQLFGCELVVEFSSARDGNSLLDVGKITAIKEKELGLAPGSLRPIIRYIRMVSRTGDSDTGPLVASPLQVWWIDPTDYLTAAGAQAKTSPNGALLWDQTVSTVFDEGPNRKGYGGIQNGKGWHDVWIWIDSTTTGTNGEAAVCLGWELMP